MAIVLYVLTNIVLALWRVSLAARYDHSQWQVAGIIQAYDMVISVPCGLPPIAPGGIGAACAPAIDGQASMSVVSAASEGPVLPLSVSGGNTGSQIVQLTEAELRAVLLAAGWPEQLLAEAMAVAWCESRWHPTSIGNGSYGLFQLVPLWFDYSGQDFEQWADPVINARAALTTYAYDAERGHSPWHQWGCRP